MAINAAAVPIYCDTAIGFSYPPPLSTNRSSDQDDEALNRWKASLGIGQGNTVADPNDPRLCIIKSLALEVEGRPDITIDTSAPGALEDLKKKPFTIKEGCKYQMKAVFVVQHQVLSGLKYVQQLKRKGIPLGKEQEMIGSYSPSTTDRPTYTKKFAPEEAPSGMMARGHYDAISRFVDDDDHTHLKFEWSFDITKDWK
jgi:Rho GDP-dissociation inhibitor